MEALHLARFASFLERISSLGAFMMATGASTMVSDVEYRAPHPTQTRRLRTPSVEGRVFMTFVSQRHFGQNIVDAAYLVCKS